MATNEKATMREVKSYFAEGDPWSLFYRLNEELGLDLDEGRNPVPEKARFCQMTVFYDEDGWLGLPGKAVNVSVIFFDEKMWVIPEESFNL